VLTLLIKHGSYCNFGKFGKAADIKMLFYDLQTLTSNMLTAGCFVIAQKHLVNRVPVSAVMKHHLYLIMLSEHKQMEHCGIGAFAKNKHINM